MRLHRLIPQHRLKLPAVLLAMAIAVVTLAGCSLNTGGRNSINLVAPAELSQAARDGLSPPALPDSANGAILYQRKCQACHGDTGAGDGPRSMQVREQGGLIPRLVGGSRMQSMRPSAWFDVVTNGKLDRLMPGFSQSLSAQERWDVLSYVWAMGTTSDLLQAGTAIYQKECELCHGLRGSGTVSAGRVVSSLVDLSLLAGQSLLDLQTLMMRGDFHSTLTLVDSEKLQVAQYVRTFSYKYADPNLLRTHANNGNGELRIQAENLTAGGSVPSNIPVILRVYDDIGEVFSRTNTLSDGVLVISGLPTQAGYFYQAEAVYNGARFFASPKQFTNTLILTATLPVYEVITDINVVSISEYHYFVQAASENTISIVELYIFDNASDRAYIDGSDGSGVKRSLQVSVPSDAINVRFDGPGIGTRFTRSGGVIYDSDAVLPGKRASRIVLIYDLPYQDSKMITRQIAYPVESWDVLLADGNLRVSGLVDRGVQQAQTGNIRIYSADSQLVSAGDPLQFEVKGQVGGVTLPGEDGKAIGFGMSTLALSAGIGYLLISRYRRSGSRLKTTLSNRQELVEAIAELDTIYAYGDIAEQQYAEKRQALKSRLREIWD